MPIRRFRCLFPAGLRPGTRRAVPAGDSHPSRRALRGRLRTLAAGAVLGPLALLSGCRPGGEGAPLADGNGLSVALAVPPAFQETTLATLSRPTAMAFAPDGRLFVCEQAGRLRVVKNGALLPTPFLTRSVNDMGERGLLGVAFDPDFASNRFVYVYYTSSSSPFVARWTASASNPDVAESGSEVVLLQVGRLDATNHNGGALAFGPDGKLYIATGENANEEASRDLTSLFGKILRINKEYSGTSGAASVPADNPFYGRASGNARAVWAYGLRNPFTFAFQPGTGRMFINDVGWQSWEEINEGAAGADYGWPATEGPTTASGVTAPFHAYPNTRNRSGGEGCAIVGAAFYDPPTARFPAEYAGDYFFGDYCEGWIRRLDPATKTVTGFATGIAGLVDLEVGPDGALYHLSNSTGRLVKVTYTGSQAPGISQHPVELSVSEGERAEFSVAASGAAPLAYQWQRDGADIAGATSATYAVAAAQRADSGARFRCRVTNSHGSAVSEAALLRVTGNSRPAAAIEAPMAGILFRAGTTLEFRGTGTDPEDGDLPPSAFTWQIDLHHDTHTHPMMPATSGSASGAFTIPDEGETSANVWLRLHLTVRDRDGLTSRAQRDIHPHKAQVTLATAPAGLQVSVDGTAFPAPHVFTGVAGMRRVVAAESVQTLGGKTWEFVSWSDGRGARHGIVTPDTAMTLTATFREAAANVPPASAISRPDTSLRFRAGQVIEYAGSASDPEDGALAASALTWRVDLVDEDEGTTLVAPRTGASGSVTVPMAGTASGGARLRFTLTSRDSKGATHTVTREIRALSGSLTLASDPAGLLVGIDGAFAASPRTVTGVVGMSRTVAAEDHSTGGRAWAFASWSDGGAAQHAVAIPEAGATLTAAFRDATSATSPVAEILTPAADFRYEAGAVLAFSGAATDPQDGTLPAPAFTWRVERRHDGTTTTIYGPTAGSRSGEVALPAEIAQAPASSGVVYRVRLSVVDADGHAQAVFRDVQPRLARVTLATSPSGLQVSLDGRVHQSPYAFNGVTGFRRTLSAPATQAMGGRTWRFLSWSDGGAAEHVLTTPSAAATLTATYEEAVANRPPVAEILTPAAGTLYEGGMVLAFSAAGTDPEDGPLPDSAFAWRVDFHHDTHVHPALAPVSGAKSGSVTVPAGEETSSDVFYRVHLTVRDRGGLAHAVYRDVHPRKVQVTLASSPAGLRLRLDGQTVVTPFVFTGVAGTRRSLSAVDRQDQGTVPYEFVSWSQGGAAVQDLVLPAQAATYTATFRQSAPVSVRRENLAR